MIVEWTDEASARFCAHIQDMVNKGWRTEASAAKMAVDLDDYVNYQISTFPLSGTVIGRTASADLFHIINVKYQYRFIYRIGKLPDGAYEDVAVIVAYQHPGQNYEPELQAGTHL